jgi:chemotaxis protein methyltransferase CheR
MENWDITILGTDINIKFLKKASQGNYRHWSFRTTPDEIKKQYFIKNKESFQIIPFIKRMVRFDYLNLAEDSYPSLLNNTSGIDLILCRNVIMYFNQQCQKKVIQKFYRSLVDGGWLIVAASETSNLLFSQFQTVNFTDAFLYKKNLHAKNSEPVFPDELIESTHYFYTPFQDQSPPADPNKQPEPGVSDYDVETTKKSSEKQPRPISYEEALFLYEAGQYSEAEKALLSIVDHEPRAVVLLVRVYANKGQIENSLSWCEKAVKKDKMNPDIHFLMSTILQEKGEINQAIKSLKRVLYLKSNFVMAHFSLGSIALKQGKNKEASRHFKNALLLAGNYDKNEILRESDGITAGRLLEITGKMTEGSITI